MFKIYFFILFYIVISFAQKKSYPTCALSSEGRVDLEGFCPRLEGVTLPNCCPALEKKPGISCNYNIIKERGQPFLANSSYQVCEGGVQKSVPCCRVMQRACFVEPVTLLFVSRLINRSNSCCFENCPPASYWRAQPNPNPKITADHELTNNSTAACISQTLQECSYGSSSSCAADSYCPPPEPTPLPTTTTTTTPSVPPPDPGTTPTVPSGPSNPGPSDPGTGPSVPSPPPSVGGFDE